MCYVMHNHGMAIEAHSRLFPLQLNVAELGGMIEAHSRLFPLQPNVAELGETSHFFTHVAGVHRFTRRYHIKNNIIL